MAESIIYSINDLDEYSPKPAVNFIFAYAEEKRSSTVIDHLINKGTCIENVIIIIYNNHSIPKELEMRFEKSNTFFVHLSREPMDFISELKSIPKSFWSDNLLIDMSCIRIPELFTLLKYIKVQGLIKHVDLSYSIPFDYVFYKEPFTSFRSYNGDLKMYELLGFSGPGQILEYQNLYLFLGFEGALGLKVFENCQYSNLFLINCLPSFFPKYKDISVINNYQLLQEKHTFLYTPADNPYEVYNLLDSLIGNKENSVCIAPLSTKPVALGICMFALEHDFVRIVYPVPVSNDYLMDNTLDIYRTNIYSIDL